MNDKSIPPTPDVCEYTQDETYREQVKANTRPLFRQDDPLEIFANWFAEAREQEPNDANAMALGTCDATGLPDVRMVLLKGFDERGFVWYSHKKSAKGQQLEKNPQAALNFHWKSLRRAVRMRGSIEVVSKAEVSAYFSTRTRDSRIGAWASQQSEPMQDRDEFENRIEKIKTKFNGVSVPLPPGWTGWRLRPTQIEFWRDRPFRLHDRLLFSKEAKSEAWTKSRLYP